MVEFLIGYWWLLIIIVAVGAVMAVAIHKFIKTPTSEQMKQVKEWLLYAVVEAEKALGSGTGQVKLRYVYDKFLAKFPIVAALISFETFSFLVDEALDRFAEMLDENENIQKYLEKK